MLVVGLVTIYRIAEYNAISGEFIPFDEFIDSGIDFSNLPLNYSSTVAKNLAEFIERNHIPGTTTQLGSDGTSSLSDLSGGLYLVNSTPPENHEALDPALFTLPYILDVSGATRYAYHISIKIRLDDPEPSNPTTP